MESLLSNSESVSRAGRAEVDSPITSNSKISLQIQDSLEERNINRQKREEISRSQIRKESRRNTRHANKEVDGDMYWSNEVTESEDNEETTLETVNKVEHSHNIELSDTQTNSLEERNNNVNVRRDIHHGQTRPSIITDDGINSKKSTIHGKDKKDCKENFQMDTDSPPTPLPSPTDPSQTTSVVDTVAGTSASVAVNSFLKFSIQNILQVPVY